MYVQENRTKYVLQSVIPVTGATIVVKPSTTALFLNAAGTLATLTVQLPAKPVDGQILVVGSAQAVTVLTFTGGTVKGLLAALAVNAFAKYVYSASDGVWFRAG